ncbi:DNA (cytosine-5-)-methyltransferase [Maridesulfovibrio sp.]|uniref:DNA cytosine methyltransferase n=1 Tax=Maridesulfovibrio sp. TaxID=2795000 RepID=UPI002A18C712|nr:DNA (cytosine-5-)-methyltransferase [Maridesulfovibrio sp.]
MNNKDRKYKVLSLFSGAMGLDIGLDASGYFETILCIEKENAFCNTIRQNKKNGNLPPDLIVIEADISKLDPEEVLAENGIDPDDIDVVVGGPPCQSFSTAGRRRTTQDPRGTLLWDFLRFVKYIKPKFFLMENVRGLLSAALKHRPLADRPNKGGPPLSMEEEPGSVVRLFAKDLSEMNGIGYRLDIFEVNSVNYGAPQIRERVLFFGNKYDLEVNFPSPTHGQEVKSKNEQASLFNSEKSLMPWKTLGDAISDLNEEEPEVLDFSPRKKEFLSLVPPGANWRSLPEEIQKESMKKAWYAKGGRSGWWRRLTFELPSPTLITMPNHASTSLCHPIETRALSVREYARVQEFPDEWEFAGKTSEKYTQIGNAVPTRLGEVAGNVLASQLDKIDKDSLKEVSTSSCDPRIVYVQSHIRTRKWFKDGKVVVWNGKGANDECSYSAPRTFKKVKAL